MCRQNRSFLRLFLTLAIWSFRMCVAEESFSIDQIVQMALKNHEKINISKLEIQKASLLSKFVISSVLPQIYLEGGITYPKEEVKLNSFVVMPSPLKDSRVVFSQLLFDARILPAYKGSKFIKKSIENFSEFQIQEVLIFVTEMFFDVLKNQKLLEVEEERVRLAREQKEIISRRFDAGEVPKTDFLQAKVELSRALRIKDEGNNRLLLSREKLKSVSAIPDAKFSLEDPTHRFEEKFNVDLEVLFAKALNSRGDIKGLEKSLEASEMDVKRAKGAFWPRVFFNAEQSWATPETFGRKNNTWVAAFRVEIPILEGGKQCLEVTEATYNSQQANLQLQRLQEDVRIRITDVWLQGRSTQGNIKSLREEVAFESEYYSVVSERYHLGRASNLDLNDAFHRFILAKTTLVNEEYKYLLLSLKLLNEIGDFDGAYFKRMGQRSA